jgi:hypothetical protein
MSQLGKYLLYFALAGAVVAALMGGLVIKQRWDDTATLKQTLADKTSAQQAAKKDLADAQAAKSAQADSDAKLTTATSTISDLNTQLEAAKKQVSDATAATAAANDATKTAQDALDAIKKTLNGKTAEEIVAAEAKAESDLTAAQSEQKIMQDQLQASQTDVSTLRDALRRSATSTQPPGISGKVTFVDHPWNFVILDVGISAGVVPNGELIVYRGRTFLGKVRVTKVDPDDAVAEILPDVQGDIQIGDSVLN